MPKHDQVHVGHLDEAMRLASGYDSLDPERLGCCSDCVNAIALMLLGLGAGEAHEVFVLGVSIGVRAKSLRAAGAFAEEHLGHDQ